LEERSKVAVIGCNALQVEYEKAIEGLDQIDVDLFTYPISCGMPESSFTSCIPLLPDIGDYDAVFIFGGFCIKDLPEGPNVFTIQYDNCFYPLVDEAIVDQYIKDGCYLLTPGWLKDWMNRIKGWGFDQKTGREFFLESTNRFVLIDTMINEGSEKRIKELSDYLDIPYEIHRVGTFGLRNFIKISICSYVFDIIEEKVKRSNDEFKRRLADISMAQDVLSMVSDIGSEDEVIKDFLNFYSILLAPKELILKTSKGENITVPGSRTIDPDEEVDLHSTIYHASNKFGEIHIKGIQFPESKNDYQVLLDTTSNVFGLALANARNFDDLNRSNNDLEEANHKLEANDQIRKEYISLIAHDIGSPINNLQIIIEMMNNGVFGSVSTDQKTQLENAMIFTKRIISLRKDTLLLTKMDLDALELERKNTDLVNLVKEILRTRSGSISEKDLEITLDTPDKIIGNVDPNRFQNILENLISNAIRYTGPGGIIEIYLKESDGNISFIIKDNGRGIQKKDLDLIFERFYRSGERIEGSTGLGLSIVKGLIESHGGKVSAESEGVGHGSRFIIEIPKDIS
jgi:signal transduction histidine kinase